MPEIKDDAGLPGYEFPDTGPTETEGAIYDPADNAGLSLDDHQVLNTTLANLDLIRAGLKAVAPDRRVSVAITKIDEARMWIRERFTSPA